MGRAIGIDLGTTNSCAAIIEAGKPRLITYENGEKTIPSVFAIDKKGNRLVGNEAKEQAAANAGNTVMASKRLIGTSFGGQATEKMKQVFTYELVEGESSEILIKVKDQVFTLEQISAAILRRIKEAAEDELDEEIDQAVITVPAYFNDRQRQAVRSAGKLAGLKVLRVLNEPTAAALAYGLGRTLNQRVAIYDLGGGTFDISIIDIKDKIFEVIATGGDTFLGGVDFDDRLMQYVMQQFLKDTGIDLSYDRAAVTRVRDAAENAKIALSSETITRITVERVAEDEDGAELDLVLDVSRQLLEKLTIELVDRSIDTCERILSEAGTTKDGIDEILLVGGQSRMPLVRSKLAKFIGKPPSQKVHPDEAVAIGAAIMAHSLSARAGHDGVTLLDVLPQPIGIAGKGGKMHVLFKRNQPLPDYKTRTLTTSRDDQRSIMLRVYQGESDYVAENELLGTFHFYNIRQAPAKAVKVSVTFHIDSEGILNLTAIDKESGQTVESRLNLGRADEPKKRKKKKKKKKPEEPVKPPTPLNMPMTSSLQQKNPLFTEADEAQDTAQPTEPPQRPQLPEQTPQPPPPHEVQPLHAPKGTPAPGNRLLAPKEEKKGFFARILSMIFFWRK